MCGAHTNERIRSGSTWRSDAVCWPSRPIFLSPAVAAGKMHRALEGMDALRSQQLTPSRDGKLWVGASERRRDPGWRAVLRAQACY